VTEAGTVHSRWISRGGRRVRARIFDRACRMRRHLAAFHLHSRRFATPRHSRRSRGRNRLPHRERIRRQRRPLDDGERAQRSARAARRPDPHDSGRVPKRSDRHRVQRSASLRRRARVAAVPVAGATRRRVVRDSESATVRCTAASISRRRSALRCLPPTAAS